MMVSDLADLYSRKRIDMLVGRVRILSVPACRLGAQKGRVSSTLEQSPQETILGSKTSV